MGSSISPSYEFLMNKDDAYAKAFDYRLMMMMMIMKPDGDIIKTAHADMIKTAQRSAFAELRSKYYAQKWFDTSAGAIKWWELAQIWLIV